MTDVSSTDETESLMPRMGPRTVTYSEGRTRKGGSGSVQVWSWCSPELYEAIMDDAKSHQISRSWAIRLALNEHYGIEDASD